MQPTLITAIPVRLDIPDASRCTECSVAKGQRKQRKGRPKRRRG